MCTEKWQASAVTAPRWRACGAHCSGLSRFSAVRHLHDKELGEKVALAFPQPGLGVIPSGMGISCLPVIDPR